MDGFVQRNLVYAWKDFRLRKSNSRLIDQQAPISMMRVTSGITVELNIVTMATFGFKLHS